MKHYLSYAENGAIFGINPYGSASGLRGWPDEYEIDDPNTTHEPSQTWREGARQPPGGGYLRYDCPCPRSARNCNCATVMCLSKYVVDGHLIDKLAISVTVDGEQAVSGQVFDKPPGSKTTVGIRIDEAPDGETIAVMQDTMPQIMLTSEPMIEMATVEGALPDVDVYAPAQGFVGRLRIAGRICTMMEVRIRGWGG